MAVLGPACTAPVSVPMLFHFCISLWLFWVLPALPLCQSPCCSISVSACGCSGSCPCVSPHAVPFLYQPVAVLGPACTAPVSVPTLFHFCISLWLFWVLPALPPVSVPMLFHFCISLWLFWVLPALPLCQSPCCSISVSACGCSGSCLHCPLCQSPCCSISVSACGCSGSCLHCPCVSPHAVPFLYQLGCSGSCLHCPLCQSCCSISVSAVAVLGPACTAPVSVPMLFHFCISLWLFWVLPLCQSPRCSISVSACGCSGSCLHCPCVSPHAVPFLYQPAAVLGPACTAPVSVAFPYPPAGCSHFEKPWVNARTENCACQCHFYWSYHHHHHHHHHYHHHHYCHHFYK